MKPVPISLPSELREFANQQCRKHHESLAAYIRRLIIEDRERTTNEQSA